MKSSTRIKNLESKFPEGDPVEKLGKIYKHFSHAYFIEGDKDKALQIRQKADAILEEHPKLKKDVPGRIGRNAFIDWSRFIKYPKTLTMEPKKTNPWNIL